MIPNCKIKAPFFEIGPKSYLYGQDVIDLAIAADKASEKYGVDIIFTTPIVEIARVKAATKRIHVFAPHMDPIVPGRGLADILPESLVAAGAEGVMLNHVEKPLDFETLEKTIKRAEEVGPPNLWRSGRLRGCGPERWEARCAAGSPGRARLGTTKAGLGGGPGGAGGARGGRRPRAPGAGIGRPPPGGGAKPPLSAIKGRLGPHPQRTHP